MAVIYLQPSAAGVPRQRLYLHAFLIRKVLSYFRNCVKLEDRLELWKIISLRWADGSIPGIVSGVFHRKVSHIEAKEIISLRRKS